MSKKNRRKMRKALATMLAALLLVVVSVGATVAYLTSNPAPVVNTFTVGANIQITLDEAKVDPETGKELTGDDAARVAANTYKLVPGYEYDKDPTVHVNKTSGDCYVFVKVENPFTTTEVVDGETKVKTIEANEDGKTIAEQIAANNWVALAEGSNIFYYNGAKATNAVFSFAEGATGYEDLVVFSNLNTEETLTAIPAEYANAQIKVTAYAVQADGFATPAAAWNATFGA